MNPYLKNQYNQHLVDYLEHLLDIQIKNDKQQFKCPICNKEESALLYPNNKTKFYCLYPECNFKGDIFDLIRKTKNPKFEDHKIGDYLSHKFKIKVKDDINDLIGLYSKNNFCLFPLEPESKNPQKGFMWTEKLYTDPKIWRDWVERGYGLALRLGKVSNVLAIDIDSYDTYEKIGHLLGKDTLIQDTKRGKHWLFSYDDDFEKINHINFRNKGYEMELRANNAYIAIAPTSAEGEIRKWNKKRIKKLPDNLKDFLLGLIDKDTKNVEDDIQEAINSDVFPEGIKGMDGRCNDTFVVIGGKLRKKMPINLASYALNVFNSSLDDPMPSKDMKNIIRQLGKYQTYDKQELADEVLKRLEVIKMASAFQLASSLKREQKDVEDVLKRLEDENKIIDIGNRKFKILEKAEWIENKEEMAIPLDFRCPYFHDYARLKQGNMIIIGSPTGRGKTTLVGNFIKQLWEQKIQTKLINTESGSEIGKITDKFKLPQDAYLIPKKFRHPTDIELIDNAVTIIDWLKVKESDYAKTDLTYEHFNRQLAIHNGLLIIFTQLRKSNNEFFAIDQTEQFGALVAKYLWGNNGVDGENTYFLTTKIRDSKSKQQIITIPTYYNHDTKIVELRK